MFNSGQSGLLFGGAATQNNTFGQTQNTPTAFFNTATAATGTTYPFHATDGTDTISKNGATVNVSTKIQFLTAMKVYENKSAEELRFEDYQSNRITSNKGTGTMFSGQPASGMMNTQTNMFSSSYSPFVSSQSNQSTLFTNTNQQSGFGNKSIFTGTSSVANTGLGAFSNQSKPTSLFASSSTSTANKTLFGSPQPTQSTGLFGSGTSSAAPTLFGTQQPVSSVPLFGQPTQGQPAQPTNLFSNTTSSFGFQPQAQSTLFGNAAKSFGSPTGFTSTSTSSAFGNTAGTGNNLFGQSSTPASTFGTQAKPSLFGASTAFPNQSVSSPSVFGQSTPVAPLGQQSGLFGTPQNVQPQNTFGNSTLFGATSKPGLFGNTTQNTGFTSQPSSGFFGSVAPFSATQTLSTSVVAPTIGYSSPAEALMQQHLSQQKILSLVSNSPYGINKLFMGQSQLGLNKVVTSSDTITNNSNIISLAIKKNDTDKFGMQRRQILDQKVKIVPSNINKIFSGFDEDEDLSTQSVNVENQFFTKREDWKYLPKNVFEKSHKSLNNSLNISNKAPLNGNKVVNANNSFVCGSSSPLDSGDTFLRHCGGNLHSTPIINNGSFKSSNLSPICYANRQLDSKSKKEVDGDNFGVSSFHNFSSANDNSVLLDNSIVLENPQKDEVTETKNEKNSCHVKLTRSGYYTAPTLDVLDKLVSVNDDGETECWVENFIIGRESYGSIRFPDLTNVFGLDLDELVDIKRKEVSVYPDDTSKPDVGEGLNKLAQIVLQEVFPIDKTTNETICDESRIKAMRFEDKVKRVTEKMGARFIRYTADKGLWIFEVDHFSKYRYDESDDEGEEPPRTETVNVNERDAEPKSNVTPSIVVTAEADSMTSYPQEEFIISKAGLDRFFDRNNNKSVQRMRESLYQNDSDDEDHSTGMVFSSQKPISAPSYRYKEEPQAKRFETFEMGKSILNKSLEDSFTDNQTQVMLVDDVDMIDFVRENCRPIKPLIPEAVASTTVIVSDYNRGPRLKVSAQSRDIKSIKMPYLPSVLSKYSGIDLKDIHKQFLYDVVISKANQFRIGTHMSSNKESPGFKFFVKDQGNQSERNLSYIQHKKSVPNAIKIMKLDYEFSNYQEQLLEAALGASHCKVDEGEDCPQWASNTDLGVLRGYVRVQHGHEHVKTEEVSLTGRIIMLCNALFAEISSNDSSTPIYLRDIERKQALSKWIRMESREELLLKVERVLQTKTKIDVEKCNDLILESLCCGEIKLACRLATVSKQHRMALLISQAAGSLRDRDALREQLESWVQDKSDRNIPANVMCIYVLLSGHTSLTLSDGSIATPLKDLKWFQALGCYLWYIQPYLDSIKSSLDLYTEDFKSDNYIPQPSPVDVTVGLDNEEVLGDGRYNDCCYTILRLHCGEEAGGDEAALLNPPAVSVRARHRLCCDWSASWHLGKVLASGGRRIAEDTHDRLCLEYAAQLERGGQWQWAAFVIMHTVARDARRSLLEAVVMRNVAMGSQLSAEERFLVEKLRVPLATVARAKEVLERAGCFSNIFAPAIL